MTRQEIYDRVRALGSRDAYVLLEMKRLGYWTDTDQPREAAEVIEREAALQRELNDLLTQQRRYESRQKMLADMRQARMADAKKRREETKQRQEQKRQERAKAWQERQREQITYLGEGVSGGLSNGTGDAEKLARFGLPQFESPLALAQAMDMTLGRLRFLTFSRKVAKISHYKRFQLPKKSGGKRTISAPMPLLKNAQYWVLEHILSKIQPTEYAHGFVPERSIVTNARPHVGQEVVVNLDLKDFFPTITFRRVKGLFEALGYAETLATILALLCTEPNTDLVQLDGQLYHVAKGERTLPQGAPTSPALTNLLAYRLDRRLRGVADKFGFAYTRYADDLTFSASGEAAGRVGQLLWGVRQVIENEGFVVHPDKLSVMRKGNQQRVTGIVVNDQPGIDRATLRKFRALLHQIGQSGWEGKQWGKGEIHNAVMGYANFVAMVKPEQGLALRQRVAELMGRPLPRPKSVPDVSETPPAKPTPPPVSDDWWNVL
jgi:RNA-directed DNA polymerase